MLHQDLLDELDILSPEDFRFPEQFIAVMETEQTLEYDAFAELLAMASPARLPDMINAFYEDLIRGVPDDDTELYGAVQTFRDAVVSLARLGSGRGTGFLVDELYGFREWYTAPASVLCIPEEGGVTRRLSPLEALMLYREEKLSGDKFQYDFYNHMPPEPGEHIYDLLYELGGEDDSPRDEDFEDYPEELPPDFDPTDYDPDDPMPFGTIDPYRDGFIDRADPVVEDIGLANGSGAYASDADWKEDSYE